ncbi:ankyrin repeat domain-containing protein [Aquamicrobium sp.]|uniref:ankyrin repeat domain-containing protein n=1 Tax=Aquamicrobium sp. TaxID=1872579 RepID=UPI00258ACAED|nr:ankyrin repeat domain-containing protein [Aquamicrobium sp.]MCK9549665.1 ankyrin repeat domain-containing protein [Aquamicrobium sp.]
MKKSVIDEALHAQAVQFVTTCEAGMLDDVSYLAEKIADIDLAAPGGKTGLMAAASRNRTNVMRFLIEKGADPNRANDNGTTALMFAKTAAFAYGDCTGMQILLDAGADRDARDNSGLTALDYTIRRAEMVRYFLESYCNERNHNHI